MQLDPGSRANFAGNDKVAEIFARLGPFDYGGKSLVNTEYRLNDVRMKDGKMFVGQFKANTDVCEGKGLEVG